MYLTSDFAVVDYWLYMVGEIVTLVLLGIWNWLYLWSILFTITYVSCDLCLLLGELSIIVISTTEVEGQTRSSMIF